MNIEIANRLQKLRKEKGYSQEELADALGISRQAVSKWERAEASPDTDNLICLAKLYGTSLDQLLDTDESIEDIKEEQKEKTAEAEKAKKDSVAIGKDGIHLVDEDGSEVFIDNRGVRAFDKDGKVVKHVNKFSISSWLEGGLFLTAVAGYLLFGFMVGYWESAWILMLLPNLICSVIRCFEKKNPGQFNAVFLSLYVYFLISMVHPSGHWEVTWIVFLFIPIYYAFVAPFNHDKQNCECECDCCDDDEDDD